jgi:hypothetical protein
MTDEQFIQTSVSEVSDSLASSTFFLDCDGAYDSEHLPMIVVHRPNGEFLAVEIDLVFVQWSTDHVFWDVREPLSRNGSFADR